MAEPDASTVEGLAKAFYMFSCADAEGRYPGWSEVPLEVADNLRNASRDLLAEDFIRPGPALMI